MYPSSSHMWLYPGHPYGLWDRSICRVPGAVHHFSNEPVLANGHSVMNWKIRGFGFIYLLARGVFFFKYLVF